LRLISFCFDLDRQTVLLQPSLCDRSSFSFSPTLSTLWSHRIPCTIYSRFSGLLGLAYFYQFATRISTPYFDLHLSILICLGLIPFCLHTDCSLHTFRELSVFSSLISLVFDHSFLTPFLISSGSYHRDSDDHFYFRHLRVGTFGLHR